MVESLVRTYKGKKVFITGHTGFKGSWLVGLLSEFETEIAGFSLQPTKENIQYPFIKNKLSHEFIGDIRNSSEIQNAIKQFNPDIVFHLAAQALVIDSYLDPVNTYTTNVIGTLNVLEACRDIVNLKAIICVTTDKVYENKETDYPYTESDQLGGYDIYSSSKACCELLVSSFRNSFFNLDDYENHNVLIATVRAGNVIGGGDWSQNRLIPDLIRNALKGKSTLIRSPKAVRPWQHVLDCLTGYLMLGERLLNQEISFAQAWNFAPNKEDILPVFKVINETKKHWDKIEYVVDEKTKVYHEANLLLLDNTKAIKQLNWNPRLTIQESISLTINWYKTYFKDEENIMLNQIDKYLNR
tara:strand:+ start:2275 stop:3342 length:1068 start_codon:yes stop_codon:yes gene_type:complete